MAEANPIDRFLTPWLCSGYGTWGGFAYGMEVSADAQFDADGTGCPEPPERDLDDDPDDVAFVRDEGNGYGLGDGFIYRNIRGLQR